MTREPVGRMNRRDQSRMVPSPCIKHCTLDEHRVCQGCLRHIDEIVAWGGLSETDQRDILARCAARRAERESPLTPAGLHEKDSSR
ncbi:DUF1289 domain-containing protein [Larsenimonas rhizosphaerae]|uniref:DUF1289 domain-containing protein n=1 Tax=Larsenimonas rhizosphaerae TaxID=2944682 RepID=UPI0033140E5F